LLQIDAARMIAKRGKHPEMPSSGRRTSAADQALGMGCLFG